MTETECIKKFMTLFEPSFYKKLHGNKFQTGMPDVILIKNAEVIFLEFKQVPGKTLPWSKCDLAQHLTLKQMLRAYPEVYYCVYSNSEKVFYLCRPCNILEGKTTKLDEACVKTVR